MTYRELLDILSHCHEEQLDQHVTICDMEGDFYTAILQTLEEDNTLPAGLLYLDAVD